jgi:predicted dehydrogenase
MMGPMQNRREFLGSLAVAAQSAPKIKMGVIGCGWYGMVDLHAAFKNGGVECVALCDVDSDHLAASAAEVEKLQGRRPKTFKHYRELLDTPGLQAVIIATMPHWHALPFIDACRRNLDIYCEKPLAYDVREGRAMIDAARRSKSVVEIGFQRRQAEATARPAATFARGARAASCRWRPTSTSRPRRPTPRRRPRPPRSIGICGADPRRKFPTVPPWGTRIGAWKPPSATGTWWIGAST